jgi:hypothetical protein
MNGMMITQSFMKTSQLAIWLDKLINKHMINK